MSTKRIEAFVCEICGKLSASESQIKKCESKHNQEKDFFLMRDKFSNYLKENLKELRRLLLIKIGLKR